MRRKVEGVCMKVCADVIDLKNSNLSPFLLCGLWSIVLCMWMICGRTRKIFMGGIKCYLHGLHITWRCI